MGILVFLSLKLKMLSYLNSILSILDQVSDQALDVPDFRGIFVSVNWFKSKLNSYIWQGKHLNANLST